MGYSPHAGIPSPFKISAINIITHDHYSEGKLPGMSLIHITRQRQHRQSLTSPGFKTPEAPVEWFGCVQSQEYYGASWSIGMRMQNATESLIDRAYDEGRILRTHIMRPTWHFITPQDLHWIMQLTAERSIAQNKGTYRKLELDATLLKKTNDLIAKALQNETYLTRVEIGKHLEKAGIAEATGRRLRYIVHQAELDLIVCSGPRQGKQFTYALVAERAPDGEKLLRYEALAKLARIYFRSHAPATERDFAWWAGLTLTEARKTLKSIASELESETIADETFYHLQAYPPLNEPITQAHFIPLFDELFVAYDNFSKIVHGGRQLKRNLMSDPPIVLDGEVIGTWKRSLRKNDVDIDVAPFRNLSDTSISAIEAAAGRYAAFVGREPHLNLLEPDFG